MIGYGYKLVLGTIFFIARLRGEKNVPSLSSEGEDEEIKEAQHSLDLALNIGVILFVELTLRWNEIQGVHKLADPGQFMPFFIGLAQFLAVLYRYVSRATRESERADRGGIDGQPFEGTLRKMVYLIKIRKPAYNLAHTSTTQNIMD